MNRFKELRLKNGYKTQDDLAKVLFVNQTAVSQWERGATTPNRTTLQKLSQMYNVSSDYLLGIDENSSSDSKGIPIPVLGDVAAGLPMEACENIIDYEDITPEMAANGEYFGLRIKGQSMEPRMLEGDVVIVKKQNYAENGDIAVVLVNGDSATVKKFKRTEQGLTLVAFNPTYEPQFYTNQDIEKLPVNVIGVVVELRAKIKK